MATVEEILRQTGLSDEQIKALDPKVTSGFTQVLSTATQTLEEAERAKRATAETFDKEISPALDKWANDSATLTAERDYYKTLAEKAKEGGFIPGKEPFTPPTTVRAADGKFVAGANAVPGSPDLVKGLRDEIGGAFAFVADTSWKYRKLFGTEMPDSPTAIIREAQAQRMSPAEFAAKKYDFAGKEAKQREEEQKKHDDAIRAEAVAETTKKFAEQGGSNPMLRQAQTSKFTEMERGVKAGERSDPLKMTREQRTQATRQVIQKEISANETVQ